MRAGSGGREDGRHKLPAFSFGRLDETSEPDIDAAEGLEHIGAQRHPRPAAAVHKGIIGRFRRRKRIGLVQKAANCDAGHSEGLFLSFGRDVRLVVRRSASCEAIPFCMPHGRMDGLGRCREASVYDWRFSPTDNAQMRDR